MFLDGMLEGVELMLLLLDGMLEGVEHPRRDLPTDRVRRRGEQGWSFEEELASCQVPDRLDLMTPFPYLPRHCLSQLPCMGPSAGQLHDLSQWALGPLHLHCLSWRPGSLSGWQSCQQGASGDQGVVLSGRVRRREEQGWSFEEELASCQGELLGCRGGLRAPDKGKIQLQ